MGKPNSPAKTVPVSAYKREQNGKEVRVKKHKRSEPNSK